jgi:hypothetical protein
MFVILVLESSVIILLLAQSGAQKRVTSYAATGHEFTSVSFQYFNQPISNDTEYELEKQLTGSWQVVMQSRLAPSATNHQTTEAQVALAPEYSSENLSIPVIIVQERADGLLRIEYFAQNWKNSYGLLLYNSTSTGVLDGQNVTLRFTVFGPPASVNPQFAPRPNGNLSIMVGSTTILSDFPIAWANLSSAYLYGLRNSTFVGGSMNLTFSALEPSG